MFPVVYWAKVSEPADFTRAVSNYALFFILHRNSANQISYSALRSKYS